MVYNKGMKGLENKITILDSVHAKASKPLVPGVYECLAFKADLWKHKRFGRSKQVITRSFLDKRNRIFLTGLMPRVETYLKSKKIPFDISDVQIESVPKPDSLKVRLKNFQLRPDQLKAVKAAFDKHRGTIIAPTGTGKTVVIMGLISMFKKPEVKILFLCHTLDLLNQTFDEFQKAGLGPLQIISGDTSRVIDKKNIKIVLSTVQSFSKIDPLDYVDFFDIVFVDEAHHCNSRKSQFGQVLQYSLAPMKIGFTATIPESQQKRLALEGLIGPVIYELTIEEGVKLKLMAKPEITLIGVKPKPAISDLKKYRDFYREGIVANLSRNRQIAKLIMTRVHEGKSVLIMVKEILHGQNIQEICGSVGVATNFVQGATAARTRDLTKKLLNEKHYKAVISTAVWREGINIPTLDVVINACGGKSEIMTLQAIGRGLRKTKQKSKVEIIDFLDPYKYLAEHTIRRLLIYKKEGWI